jgi:hypothetical protein
VKEDSSHITAHPPGTGHFRCDCGLRLAFGVPPKNLTLLVNQPSTTWESPTIMGE